MKKRVVRFGALSDLVSQTMGTLSVRSVVDDTSRGPLSIFQIKMRPHASHPFLWHGKTSEFFLVTKGSVRGTVGRRSQIFKKGDFAYLPPGAIHGFRAGRKGVEVLTVFTPALNLKKPDIHFCKRA